MTLKSWRKSTGRTAADVAKELGVSRQAYGRYESGARTPGYPIINKIVVMTSGLVTANSWLNAEASEVAARAGAAELNDNEAAHEALARPGTV